MSMMTWLGSLVCAGGLLAGPDRAGEAPSAAIDSAVVLAGHKQCDPCDECAPCKRGLRGLFKRCNEGCTITSVDCGECDADCGADCCERRGLLVKLGRLIFGRRTACCECGPVCDGPCGAVVVKESTTVAAPVKREIVYKPTPKAETPKPVAVEPTTSHAKDYTWVQGRLEFAHVNGGAWLVRYAGLGENDIYGGSVVLVRDARMSDYREGDLVRIHGEIVHENPSVFLRSPLYRINDVTLVRSVADAMYR